MTRETRELTTVDARRELTRLPEKLGASPATVAVTRRGKPVLAIMTWEDYQAIVETLEILDDDKAVTQLRRSIKEVKEGKTVPWADAKARLISVILPDLQAVRLFRPPRIGWQLAQGCRPGKIVQLQAALRPRHPALGSVFPS